MDGFWACWFTVFRPQDTFAPRGVSYCQSKPPQASNLGHGVGIALWAGSWGGGDVDDKIMFHVGLPPLPGVWEQLSTDTLYVPGSSPWATPCKNLSATPECRRAICDLLTSSPQKASTPSMYIHPCEECPTRLLEICIIVSRCYHLDGCYGCSPMIYFCQKHAVEVMMTMCCPGIS